MHLTKKAEEISNPQTVDFQSSFFILHEQNVSDSKINK